MIVGDRDNQVCVICTAYNEEQRSARSRAAIFLILLTPGVPICLPICLLVSVRACSIKTKRQAYIKHCDKETETKKDSGNPQGRNWYSIQAELNQ